MRTGEGDMETDGGLASPSSGAEAIAVGREESAEGVGSEDGGARRLLGRLRSFAPADGSLLDSDDEHPAAVLD